jgi:hypothetical protein
MYYARAEVVTNWFELFNSGTNFIDFLTYPFVRFLHLSFYSVMLIFSFLGFQGLLLFYLTAKENISNLPVKFAGFTILEILFLLPNAHFWSASIGKGSIMVMGIGMFFYGLSRFNRRYLYIIIGCFFIYMVRKHILVGILVGVVFGIFFGNLKVNGFVKLIIAVVCGFVFLTLYQSLALETGIDFDLNDGGNESVEHLATELAKSNSGVDIQVEVENLTELKEALDAGAKSILIDNFTTDQMKEAVAFTKGRALLEASGGIDLDQMRIIAATGVDRISLGKLTKDIKAVDFSMRIL